MTVRWLGIGNHCAYMQAAVTLIWNPADRPGGRAARGVRHRAGRHAGPLGGRDPGRLRRRLPHAAPGLQPAFAQLSLSCTRTDHEIQSWMLDVFRVGWAQVPLPGTAACNLMRLPVCAQTILVAYHRGRMAPEGGATGGLMAAVGLGAEAADARIRKEGLGATVVACDNSAVNVTLAGAGPNGPLGLCRALKMKGRFMNVGASHSCTIICFGICRSDHVAISAVCTTMTLCRPVSMRMSSSVT